MLLQLQAVVRRKHYRMVLSTREEFPPHREISRLSTAGKCMAEIAILSQNPSVYSITILYCYAEKLQEAQYINERAYAIIQSLSYTKATWKGGPC